MNTDFVIFRRMPFFSLCLVLCLLAIPLSAAETTQKNWVLAAQKFTFSQKTAQSVSAMQFASVLPQLMLEQISIDGTRVLPSQEVLDRKLNTLQTERLSLFLQLSKEYQTRDALVLSNPKPKKLAKALEKEQEKIDEIQKKIDDNLEATEQTRNDFAPKIDREEAIARGEKIEEAQRDRWRFPFPFFMGEDEEEPPQNEIVTIYRNDSTALFSPSENAVMDGITSRTYEKEVTGANINGLLTGTITGYGDYLMVSVNLYVYPGAKLVGSVTEVGTMSDQMDVAERIVQQLVPKIANSLPVNLRFEVVPEEAARVASLTLDGLVYTHVPSDLQVDASVHTISVEAKGYETASFTYKYEGNEQYRIRISLTPAVNGVLNLRLKKARDGIFYAKGLEQSPVDERQTAAPITVNGKSVLGIFTVGEGDEAESAFFYIPENRAFDGAQLKVNAQPFNREQNIDKRRRWMYTAYSALICSLPFTFYTTGNATATANAYNLDGRVTYDDARKWEVYGYVTTGITIAAGVWTVIELVRYLLAANQVLPATAYLDKGDYSVPQEKTDPVVTLEVIGDKITPDGDGIDDTITFKPHIENVDESPERWNLSITDQHGGDFRNYGDIGDLPDEIVWDGFSDTGEPVYSRNTYSADLSVTLSGGDRLRTGKENTQTKVSITTGTALLPVDDNEWKVVMNTIEFAANQATFDGLSDNALQEVNEALDDIVELIQRRSNIEVVIQGYANNVTNTETENEKELVPLSQKRAETIREALIKRGIDASILTAEGKGGENPLAAWEDKANWWKNRRIEFIFKKKGA